MHRGPICGREMKFVMKEDTVMLKRLSALPILTFIVLIAPLQAIASSSHSRPFRLKIIIGTGRGIICGPMVTAGHFCGCSHS